MRKIDIMKLTAHRLAPHQLYLSRVTKNHAEDVIATIELDEFMSLRRAARDRSLALNALKYFNIDSYMPVHVKRALLLEVHGNRTRNILDIGTGFGYFPYVCRFFNDGVIAAIDVPGHQLFDDITEFLGINKVHHRLMPFEKLPEFPDKFDLVTASQVAFNRYTPEKPWGSAEWSFLLEDLRDNVLGGNGEVYFELNYDHHLGNWYSKEVIQQLKAHNAKISAGHVHIKW